MKSTRKGLDFRAALSNNSESSTANRTRGSKKGTRIMARPRNTETPVETITEPIAGSTENTEPVQPVEGEQSIVLTYHGTQKNGLISFNRDGVRSSVYFGKGMFDGAIPQTITITGSGFAAPGSGSGSDAEVETDPAKLAEKQAKLKAAADKAQASLAKAQARALKAQEKSDKLAAKLGVVAPVEPNTDAPAM